MCTRRYPHLQAPCPSCWYFAAEHTKRAHPRASHSSLRTHRFASSISSRCACAASSPSLTDRVGGEHGQESRGNPRGSRVSTKTERPIGVETEHTEWFLLHSPVPSLRLSCLLPASFRPLFSVPAFLVTSQITQRRGWHTCSARPPPPPPPFAAAAS